MADQHVSGGLTVDDSNGALKVTLSGGTVNVTSTDADAGAPGSAVPAAASYFGGTDGANLRGVLVDSTGKLQIATIANALPTGANVIGALSANQSTNTAQVNGTTVLTGTGAQGAGSPRVTVATDSATVAGSASLPTGANVIGALSANQSVNNAQVNGVALSTGTGAVGTGTQRVAVAVDSATVAGSASLPTGANVIGALTANQSINQAQVNGVTVLTGTGATGTGAQRVTVATDTATVAGSATLPAGTNTVGAVNQVTGQGKTLLFAKVDVAASGDNSIVAADATRKIKVVSYVIVADAAVNAKWRSATTDLTGAMNLGLNGGVSAVGQPSAHLLETVANQALNLNLSGAVGARGHISYFLE